jgi:RNA polymerase sigma-70 factor (ECF subfamily)
MEEDDAALLAAVCDGSRAAFNLLVDRHQQAVRVFLRRVVGKNDADDVAQETFLALWTQARAFRGGSAVRSWLFGIAWRKAKDSQRSWFRRRRRDHAWHEELDDHEEFAVDMHRAMEKALASLTLEQRAAVTACLAYGLSHAEAAESLQMPLGTVKSHVSRGRERLREALGEG